MKHVSDKYNGKKIRDVGKESESKMRYNFK